MIKKKYEELQMTDDFMFGKVMEDEELCQQVLETLIGVNIGAIEYPERQKDIHILAEGKNVRLDVYAQDDKEIVYDAEMQRELGGRNRKEELPKRSRYYQGMIDLNLLAKGVSYQELKECYVIFICTFDPFGEGLYQYTFRNVCQENSAIELKDQTVKVFFNTKGTVGNVSKGVKNFLRYLETAIPNDELTEKLDTRVKEIRVSEKWRREYMKSLLYEMEVREWALREGWEVGRKEGIKEGIKEGVQEGRKEGRKEGIDTGTGRVNLLIQKLAECGRMDDIVRAASEPEYQKELFREFGIE